MKDHAHIYEEREDCVLACFECDYTRAPKVLVADAVMEAVRVTHTSRFRSVMLDVVDALEDGAPARAAAIALRAAGRSPGTNVVSVYGHSVGRELDLITDESTGEPPDDDNATIIGGPRT